MNPPTPRRRRLAIGAAAVAAIVLVVVIAVVAGGGDDDRPDGDALGVVASTAPSSTAPSSASGSSPSTSGAPTTTEAAPSATDEPSADDAATTLPSSGVPAETSEGEPGAATPTTAPSPDSLVTVPTGTLAIADPIPPDEVGDFGTGVTAEIVTIEAVEGEARLPGEISGPALRVRVKLTNDTDGTVNLSRVLVDVTSGPDRTPGLALGNPGAEPFNGELAAGRSAEGVYVFGVPVDERGQVQVNVSYDVTAPILVFEGPAPRA